MRSRYKILHLIILVLTISIGKKANAQLCQGSLGDPVVNITFGSGAGAAAALDSNFTNYNYVSYSCPNDGVYTIGNSSTGCFDNTWHVLNQDHTPNDTSGYMMIINASFTPGDFYVKRVDGLCDNTTYEFAAWIMNILRPFACNNAGILPNVTFNIETLSGSVLQTYQTGNIPMSDAPLWKQYGLFFTTPVATNSIVIRMTNNAPGGCGNDLVLDDITFRPCGPKIDVAIKNDSASVFVCEGDSPTFIFNSSVVPNLSNTAYQWQRSTDLGVTWTDIAGAINPIYTRLPIPGLGVYKYRLAVTQGDYILIPACSRVLSEILTVSQVAIPVAGASSNGPVCEGATLLLKANDASVYAWTGPLNFSSSQPAPEINNVSINYNGKFYLKIVSAEGCVNTDSTNVTILPGPVVNAGNDADICEGESVQLSGSSSVSNYEWQPAQNLSNNLILNPVASPVITTLYILSSDNGACKKSDSVTVRVNITPVANAGPDKVIIQGDAVTLNGSSNITSAPILWKPYVAISSTSELTPTVSPTVSTTYILKLTSTTGCGTSEDSTLVKVFARLFIPNAFTPNNDGINDTWKIETLGAYPSAVLNIYNRYGQTIFSNNRKSIQWDGKYKGRLQPVGAYPYTIDLRNGAPLIKGVVILVL